MRAASLASSRTGKELTVSYSAIYTAMVGETENTGDGILLSGISYSHCTWLRISRDRGSEEKVGLVPVTTKTCGHWRQLDFHLSRVNPPDSKSSEECHLSRECVRTVYKFACLYHSVGYFLLVFGVCAIIISFKLVLPRYLNAILFILAVIPIGTGGK